MADKERRSFLRSSGIALTAAALAEPMMGLSASAQTPKAAAVDQSARTDATRKLASFIVSSRFDDLPEGVRHEAARTLLNWVGCAIGGSGHDTVANAIAALIPFVGSGQASLFGRTERVDVLHASLLNAISSHVFDFDDTHAYTAIHPA